MTDFNKSGSKYLRSVPCSLLGRVNVYAMLDAFDVTCPARQHAIKQDLREARDAIDRAIQMQEAREAAQ